MLNTLPNGWVRDDFEISQDGYTYRDAVVMPPEQYAAMTPDQLSAMKRQRFEDWLAMVTALPLPIADATEA